MSCTVMSALAPNLGRETCEGVYHYAKLEGMTKSTLQQRMTRRSVRRRRSTDRRECTAHLPADDVCMPLSSYGTGDLPKASSNQTVERISSISAHTSPRATVSLLCEASLSSTLSAVTILDSSSLSEIGDEHPKFASTDYGL